MKALIRILVTAFGLVAPASLAYADSATVLGDLNVRAGPGTNFPVIGSLVRGMNVQVMSCTPAWCSIGWRGPAYVSAAYLGFDGPPPYIQPGPVVVVPGPSPVPVAPAIVIAPPTAPLVYAAPPPVLFYPPPPRFYGPPPAPGPYVGFGVWSW
ncbi:SH3 domain-containing protein [Roseixanthobacter pseudopolyaromaticivorans]|uniref:SH3 domain-containing protein n=1 Tax=Xanthobacteraceae TaxID=335928 RepID=UPI003729F03F